MKDAELVKTIELLLAAIEAKSEPLKKDAGEILLQKIEALIDVRIKAYIKSNFGDDGK